MQTSKIHVNTANIEKSKKKKWDEPDTNKKKIMPAIILKFLKSENWVLLPEPLQSQQSWQLAMVSKRSPYGFWHTEDVLLVWGWQTFNFFSSVLPKALLLRHLKQIHFRARRLCVKCIQYGSIPLCNATVMKAGLLARTDKASGALYVLVNNMGTHVKKSKSQKELHYSCQSAISPIYIGGEISYLASSSKWLMISFAHNGTLESRAASGMISRKDVRLAHKVNN